MNSNDQAPLCHMPWYAMTVTGQGDIKPCCQYRGSFGNLHQGASLKDARSSEACQELKQRLAAHERVPECGSCWQREKILGQSRRMWFASKFAKNIETLKDSDNEPLVQMDLNLSNRCNLKCRMCGSWGSHLWAPEDAALSKIDRRFKREGRPEKLRLFELGPEHIDEIAPSFPSLRRIDFKGGEPMLARAHPYLLQKLIDMNLHQRISLSYTTNGTVINPTVLNLLAKFKAVRITVSIEAIGKLYSYIRGGRFALEDIARHVQVYSGLENVEVSFNVAIQAYNVLTLSDLWRYLNSLNLPRVSARDAFKYTVVNSPEYLSPWVLPAPLKALAVQRMDGIDELQGFQERLKNSESDPALWDIFCRFSSSLDELRNESLTEVVPEMQDFLQKHQGVQIAGS